MIPLHCPERSSLFNRRNTGFRKRPPLGPWLRSKTHAVQIAAPQGANEALAYREQFQIHGFNFSRGLWARIGRRLAAGGFR